MIALTGMTALQIEFGLVALIAAASFAALRKSTPRYVWLALAALYLMDLAAITLLGRTPADQVITALTPGHSLLWVWSVGWEYSAKYTARQIIGNVLMFVPVGLICHKLIGGKPWRTTLLTAAGISILIELTQFITRRGTLETDDLIFNVWGALIGAGLYQNVTDAMACNMKPGKALKRLIPALSFALVLAAACARPLYFKYFG